MLLIKNGRIITLDKENPFIENGFVVIENSKIKKVAEGTPNLDEYAKHEVIDALGMIIMPGLINTHHHAYSAFARGCSFPEAYNKNFTDVLQNIWWKMDRKLELIDTKYSAYVTFIESLLNGVTTVIDHHASYGSVRGSLTAMEEARNHLGIRASLCFEASDRDGKDKFQDSIDENIEFIKYAKEKKSGFVSALFGLHASSTLSNESLKKCKEAESKVDSGFHVHTAEDISDVHDSLKKSGCRVIERLFNYNILGEKTIAVHGIHTNKREHELLKETNTVMSHAPESNMGNAVGCAPLMSFFEEGILVGLGTDGYTSDILESLKVTMCLQRHNMVNTNIGWPQIPNMLLENNREIVRRQFGIKTGMIKNDYEADIIIVDYMPYTTLNKNNIGGHTLFGLSGRMTNTVIVGGKVIIKNREFTEVDIEEIYKKSIEVSKKLWAKLQ